MPTLTRSIIRRWLPRRRRDANKGDCGRVYIIAGSRGMLGAGVLTATAAMRAGAGLVRFGTVKSLHVVAVKRAPLEVTTEALPETAEGLLSPRAWKTIATSFKKFRPHIVVVGPGLGQSGSVRFIVNKVLHNTDFPMVLDADGLNVVAKGLSLKRKGPVIITPHPGELARLLKVSIQKIQKDRERYVTLAAKRFSCVCVLKGEHTLIADTQSVWKNPTGNAGLASGGTGDVLTGIIASLWGQSSSQHKADALKSACLGVYLHGLAGDLSLKKYTVQSLIASDVITALPQAYRFVQKR